VRLGSSWPSALLTKWRHSEDRGPEARIAPRRWSGGRGPVGLRAGRSRRRFSTGRRAGRAESRCRAVFHIRHVSGRDATGRAIQKGPCSKSADASWPATLRATSPVTWPAVRRHGAQEPQGRWCARAKDKLGRSCVSGPPVAASSFGRSVTEALCLRHSLKGCIKQVIESSGR